ncbi:MAG: hypothetical protein AAFW60_06855, partial [Pseudomonadota bacterium]
NRLDDPHTLSFLNTLDRVEPKVSQQLHQDVDAAIASGASDDQLATLVVAAYGPDVFRDFDDLVRADSAYIEKIARLGQTGLAAVSRQAPRYCRMSTYEAMAQLDEQAAAQAVTQMFAYQSRSYNWSLRFAKLKLEAVEDGRNNPKKYGKLTREDEQAAFELLHRFMNSQKMQAFNRLSSLSEAEQIRALSTMNFCDLGVEFLSGFNALPGETKSRILVQANALDSEKAVESFVKDTFGNSCGVCGLVF